MAYSGRFTPTNNEKYIGDPRVVIYRSSWERRVFVFLDRSPSVLKWGSEIVIVPYISPIDGKYHRYFTDLYIKTIDNEYIIEIKPEAQTKPPKTQKKVTKQYLKKVETYAVNNAKWQAAKKFCDGKNWRFQIWTENVMRSMGIKI